MTSPVFENETDPNEFTQIARSRIVKFQTFETTVLAIQRRRKSMLVCAFLENLKQNILKESKTGEWVKVGKEIGATAGEALSAYTQTKLRPKLKELELGGKIFVSMEGQVTVPRNTFPRAGSVLLTAEEFVKCVEIIKHRSTEDPIEVGKTVEEIVKHYFIDFCKSRQART